MDHRSGRTVFYLVAAILLLAVGAILANQLQWFSPPRQPPAGFEQFFSRAKSDSPSTSITPPTLSGALGIEDQELVDVGGIKRPKRDLAFADDSVDFERPDDANEPDPFTSSLFPNPGKAPAVPADANPQVQALYTSLLDPETTLAARSSLFEPEPFDLDEYRADPAVWLNLIRPGRVYQPAQPVEGVRQIKSNSPAFQQVLQGEQVNLEVQVDPGMPVTFYTPQVGEFPNRLTTHSVAADDQGVARTVYTAGPGSLGLVDILAASPVHSGQVRFKIRVSLPD